MPGLTNMQDAYGHAVYDHWRKKAKAYEIVERDDGYIDSSSGAQAYFAEFKKWMRCERQAIRFARGRVLDIGCGVGRVLLHLKAKGHAVCGIDNSPLAIKVCRECGLDDTHVRSITQIGPDLGPIDTIVMYGNNFGLFGSFKRARWLLRRMYNLTSDGARIIATSLDPHISKLPEHLAYRKANRKRGRMSGQIRIRVRYHRYKTPYFDYLLASEKETNRILDGTGWKIGRIFKPDYPIYTMVLEKEALN